MINPIEDLRNHSSRLDKECILNDLRNEAYWLEVFRYAYDQDVSYGLATFHNEPDNVGEPTQEMFDILDRLKYRELTGNAAYDAVRNYMDKTNSCLISLICRKDLNCGITATTLNNVYGKHFLPQFKVQLAKEVPLSKLGNKKMAVQLKYDGVRVVALVSNGKVTFKTRNGKIFRAPKIAAAIESIYPDYSNFILDGEFIIDSGKVTERTSISGIVNSAIRGSAIQNDRVKFVAFDWMPLMDFNSQSCKLTYAERFAGVETHVSYIAGSFYDVVDYANTLFTTDPKDANDFYEQVIADGYEGIVLKPMDSLYTFKRSKDWIKVKEIKDATVTCIGIKEGKPGTKYENGIGSLLVEGVIEGEQVTDYVGTGLTDEDRNRPYGYFVGKKIDIQYNTLVYNSTQDCKSIFLSRYIAIRGDL